MTQIILTAGTSWTVPADWNPAANTIEAIGGGAAGGATVGGAGADYAKVSNQNLSGSITIAIGAAGTSGGNGGDTTFGSILLAKGGGSASTDIGSTTYAGGTTTTAGGGGAAGPSGAGGNASGSAGGTADNGTVPADTSGNEWGTAGSGGGGSAAATAYWDQTRTDSSIAISGALVTRGASTAAWKSAVGAVSQAAGKFYFEVAIGAMTNKDSTGIVDASFVSSTYVGASVHSIGWLTDGRVLQSGIAQATIATYGASDVLMIAVDVTNSFLYLGKNGTWLQGNPSAGTGGIKYAATGSISPGEALYQNGSTATLHMSSGELSYAPPSGYASWA